MIAGIRPLHVPVADTVYPTGSPGRSGFIRSACAVTGSPSTRPQTTILGVAVDPEVVEALNPERRSAMRLCELLKPEWHPAEIAGCCFGRPCWPRPEGNRGRGDGVDVGKPPPA